MALNNITAKLGIVLAIICSIVLILSGIKVYLTKREAKQYQRQMQQQSFDLKAKAFEDDTASVMEEGRLFGIRALDAGHTGGIAQTTPLQSAASSSSAGGALLGRPAIQPSQSFPPTRNSILSILSPRKESTSRATSFLSSTPQSAIRGTEFSSLISPRQNVTEDNLTAHTYAKGDDSDETNRFRQPRLYVPPFIADASRATLIPPSANRQRRKSKSLTLKPRDYQSVVPTPQLSPRAAFEALLAQDEQLITYRGGERITSVCESVFSNPDDVPVDPQVAMVNFMFNKTAIENQGMEPPTPGGAKSLRLRRASTGSTMSIMVAFSNNPFDDSRALLTARSMLSSNQPSPNLSDFATSTAPSPMTTNRYTRKLSQASTLCAEDYMHMQSKLSMYGAPPSPIGGHKQSNAFLTPVTPVTFLSGPESPTATSTQRGDRRPSSGMTLSAAESPITSLMSAVARAHQFDFNNSISSQGGVTPSSSSSSRSRKSSLLARKLSAVKLAIRKSSASRKSSGAALKARAPSAYTVRGSVAGYSISDYYENAGNHETEEDYAEAYTTAHGNGIMSPVNEEAGGTTWLSLDEPDDEEIEVQEAAIAEVPKALVINRKRS